MFEHIPPFAGDPILSLNEAFQHDPRPHKVNLSIGIYFDDAGRIPVLDCVRRAEAPGVLGTQAVKWNFTKFLVGQDGQVLKRYAPTDTPESLAQDIEKALAA